MNQPSAFGPGDDGSVSVAVRHGQSGDVSAAAGRARAAVVPSQITYALFRRSADGALLPLDGGPIVQAVGSEPSVEMGSIRDAYTSRMTPAREWLDVTSTKGFGPEGSH